MHMLDALKNGTAYCPYYHQARQMADYTQAKYIATDDGCSFYVVWADTGNFVRFLSGAEFVKAQGRNDWTNEHALLASRDTPAQ